MAKRVGFWFFTGDWMKDPELRFCSLFARGLLIDLLCMMFEGARQGELSRPDGTPRSDTEIVDAVSGGSRQDKINALRELEASGALKRNKETGVLYSSRMLEIAKLSAKNKANGSKPKTNRSKKGSESEAKSQPFLERVDVVSVSENRGVTDTDSDTDSDSINSFIPFERLEKNNAALDAKGTEKRAVKLITPMVANFPVPLAEAFRRWMEFQFAKTGQAVPEMQQDLILMDLSRRGVDKAIEDVNFSIRIGAKNILDSSHDLQKPSIGQSSQPSKSYGQSTKERVGI